MYVYEFVAFDIMVYNNDSISKFFTSMYVYEFCGFDIVPDIEEKASIYVVKEGRIGASSEYRTRYRSFLLRYRSHDFDIGCGKERRIGASSKYRTLYRSFLLRYRSHNFDIEVYEYPIS